MYVCHPCYSRLDLISVTVACLKITSAEVWKHPLVMGIICVNHWVREQIVVDATLITVAFMDERPERLGNTPNCESTISNEGSTVLHMGGNYQTRSHHLPKSFLLETYPHHLRDIHKDACYLILWLVSWTVIHTISLASSCWKILRISTISYWLCQKQLSSQVTDNWAMW